MTELPSKINQAEDVKVLLRIFPAEVWNAIFPKCTSESSLSLCNASACFRNWLLPKRTTYLFPLVWSVIKDTYVELQEQHFLEEKRRRAMETSQQLDEFVRAVRTRPRQPVRPPMPPLIFSDRKPADPITLSHNSTLTLRLVCKDWRDGIDSVTLKELDHMKLNPWQFLENATVQKWVSRQETKLSGLFNFEKFEQIVLNQNWDKVSNFVRAIEITGWNADVFSLLERIGSHVWYCTIKTYNRSYSNDVAYINIRDSLNLLPNLKTLEIDEGDVPNGRNPETVSDEKLIEIVCKSPIGKLAKLQVLSTINLPFPIFNEIVRSNSQIKILYADRTICCGQYDICTGPMPNLEELSFQIFTEADLDVLFEFFVSSMMTKFYLTVETRGALNWGKIIHLFRQKWSDNVVALIAFESELEGLGKDVADDIEMLHLM